LNFINGQQILKVIAKILIFRTKYKSFSMLSPPSFEEIKQEGGSRHLLWCTAVQKGLDNQYFRCAKKYRKTKLPNVCHHVFSIPVPDPYKVPKTRQPQKIHPLISEIASFTAELNLSLNIK
jgi:hypothetical protein